MGTGMNKICNCNCQLKPEQDSNEIESDKKPKIAMQQKTNSLDLSTSTDLSKNLINQEILSCKAPNAESNLSVIKEQVIEATDSNLDNKQKLNNKLRSGQNPSNSNISINLNKQGEDDESKHQNIIPTPYKQNNSNNITNIYQSQGGTNLCNDINGSNNCIINDWFADSAEQNWKNWWITNLVSQDKWWSNDKTKIMYKGCWNKLLLNPNSSLHNLSLNVEKFCILTQESLHIFKNKENFLLMKAPQFTFPLGLISSCRRIDLSIQPPRWSGLFFWYINWKKNSKSR